jgi:hypothetical protein
MNRRRLITALLGVSLLTPAARAEVRRDALTEEQKDRLREALPYPTVQIQVGFNFSEKTGILLESSGAEQAREEAEKRRDRERYEELKRAGEPKESEALAAYLVERAEVSGTGEAEVEGAKSDRARARDIYRKLAADAPNAARKSVLLARAADAAGSWTPEEGDGAVADAREAVKLAPDSVEAWSTLSNRLLTQALSAFSKADRDLFPGANLQPMALFAAAMSNSARLGKLLRTAPFIEGFARFRESVAAARKAYELAPRQPGRLMIYTIFLFLLTVFEATGKVPGEAADGAAYTNALKAAMQENGLVGILEKEVGEAEPTELSSAFFFVAVASGDPAEGGKPKLDARLKTLAAKLLARLTAVWKSEKQPGDVRARAAGATALVQFLSDDRPGAGATCEAAIGFAPDPSLFHELLIALHGDEKDFRIAERHVEALLKLRETVLYRAIYARTQGVLKGPEAAETQYRALLKQEPKSLSGTIGVGVALLKQSKDADKLAEAADFLRQAREIARAGIGEDDHRVATLAFAAFYAVRDNLPDAREMMKTLPESQKDNDDVKAVAAIIGA